MRDTFTSVIAPYHSQIWYFGVSENETSLSSEETYQFSINWKSSLQYISFFDLIMWFLEHQSYLMFTGVGGEWEGHWSITKISMEMLKASFIQVSRYLLIIQILWMNLQFWRKLHMKILGGSFVWFTEW